MASQNDHGAETIWARINDVVNEPLVQLPPLQGFETAPLVSLEEAVQSIKLFVDYIEQKVIDAKKKCATQVQDRLSIDELAAIRLYTMEWKPHDKCLYVVLNQTLRDEDRDKLKPWFRYLRLFIGALVKIPSTNRHIFRGVKMNLSQQYKKGEKVTWWGFSSSTEFLHVLQSESFLGKTGERTLFYIESYSAVDIRSYSQYQRESELLFLPTSQFLVVSCLDVGQGLHIIHLKEIEPMYPIGTALTPSSLLPVNVSQPIISPVTTNEPRTRRIDVIHYNLNLERHIQSYAQHSIVDISQQHVTDEDIPIVVREAMDEKQCTKLNLRGNEITWFGVSILAEAIRHNTTLEELDLSQNRLNDADVSQLTKGLLVNDSIYTPIYHFCGMTKTVVRKYTCIY